MKKINEKLLKINNKNSFQKVTKRINEYKKSHPSANIVSLGIGDVSLPIASPIINAMHKAVDDLSDMSTFKGYGAYYGYDFLKKKIIENDYKKQHFTYDEIYIADGSKSDVTNILELFDIDSQICVSNIMYPIYKDGALCLNRKIIVLKECLKDSFIPTIPKKKYDIIYLCSPNNPTGIAYSKETLDEWVKYAIKHDSIILYDNVYYSYIQNSDKPKTIYEITDSKKVAIEFRSFSKKAGFTGVRCSYYVIPKELSKNINELWKKRTINRFNGADYIAQRGAEASYLLEAKRQIKKDINYYMTNARLLKTAYEKMGFKVYGGIDAPYLWIKIKENINSWEYFELMLAKLNIIVIPGIVFGEDGDNYFRISSFGNRDNIKEAIKRLEDYYE